MHMSMHGFVNSSPRLILFSLLVNVMAQCLGQLPGSINLSGSVTWNKGIGMNMLDVCAELLSVV